MESFTAATESFAQMACNGSGVTILEELDTLQEAAVWGVYLAYALAVGLVASTLFCCCACVCALKSRKTLAVNDGTQAAHIIASEAEFEPNREAAVAHLARTSPTEAGKWRPIFFTGLGEMSEIGGTGTELYFRLLRALGYVFLVMAGLTAPTAALGYVGIFAPDSGGELARTSISNLGLLEEGGLESQQARLVSIPFLPCELIRATILTEYIAQPARVQVDAELPCETLAK